MSRFTSITQFPSIGITTSIVEFAKPTSGYPCLWLMPVPISTEPVTAQAVLQEIAKLKMDWDGYGALPVTPDSCSHAQRFLAATPQGMKAPEITPTSNGTITLEWESSEGNALIEIGRTRYSGHIQPKHGQTFYLQGGLATGLDQQIATERQVLAVIKELLYAGLGSWSVTHSIQVSTPAF
jgi:hypothetical protein